VWNAQRFRLWQEGSLLNFKSGMRKYKRAMRLLCAEAGMGF